MGNDEATFACGVCGNTAGNRAMQLREMMFGTRERFGYVECARCGCVQIEAVPDDLARHYPADYYAYAAPSAGPAWKRMLKRRRGAAVFGGGDLLGSLLARVAGEAVFYTWARQAGLTTSSAVLDVGSGAGVVLHEMHAAGFTRLTGADPFLAGDSEPLPGLRLLRQGVDQVQGEYDLVMLHHSFEHMPRPGEVFGHLRRLVRPGGTVLVRTPVAGRYAGCTYGADWMQLDPPRHLFVHTEASIAHLAAQAGLRVREVVYDSTGMQFWGSELYRRDLPLLDAATHVRRDLLQVFTAEQLQAWEDRAAELNAQGDGDQACFYLSPT